MTIEATPEQTQALDYLRTELTKLFPTSGLNIRVRRILGEENIHVTYTNNARAEDCTSGIILNDPAYMSFAIWNDKAGFYIERPTTHRDVLSKCGCKRFVTMKGQSEMQCAIKLVAWFKKYSTAILTLGR